MKARFITHFCLLATALGAIAQTDSVQGGRIRIVPQTTDGRLEQVQESPDGSRLLTHDKAFAPRLWDAKTLILLRVLGGHKDFIRESSFSNDGKLLFTRSQKLLIVWDTARASQVMSFPAPGQDEWTDGEFSPDGQQVALGTKSGDVFVCNARNPLQNRIVAHHSVAVSAVSISRDSKMVASGAADSSIKIAPVAGGVAAQDVKGATYPIAWLTYSRDGKWLLASGLGKAATLFSSEGTVKATYAHEMEIMEWAYVNLRSAVWAGDGNQVLICTASGDMQIFAPGAATPARVLKGHTGLVREVRVSRTGQYVGTYGSDETLRLWDTIAGKELPYEEAGKEPTAADFSSDSRSWWVGYSHGEIRRYDLKTGKAESSTLGSVDSPYEVRVLGPAKEPKIWIRNKDQRLFSGENTFHLFLDVEGSRKPLSFNLSLESLEFSNDGKYAAGVVRSGDANLLCFDTTTGHIMFSLTSIPDRYVFTQDSKRLIVNNSKGLIGVYDIAQGKALAGWDLGGPEGLYGLATLREPNLVLALPSGGAEGVIFDVITGELKRKFPNFGNEMLQTALSQDGKRLAVMSYKGTYVLDLEAGKFLPLLGDSRLSGLPRDIDTSADGARVVSSFYRGYRVSDAVTGAVVFEEVRSSDSGSTKNSLSPDGKRIITVERTNARIIDLKSGKPVFELNTVDEIESARYVLDGTKIMTVSNTGGAEFWDPEPLALTESSKANAVPQGRKRASLVMMKDGSWLVYDDAGRYDATDPSDVQGAKFVLDWSDGLEPINVSQLKGMFYEPNLLAKVLGVNKEPLRDVPALESLKLYPSISLERTESKPDSILVKLQARDGGGIGRVSVSLNGKQVVTKQSAGFFEMNLVDYNQFMLPDTYLPKGQGNLLSVTATNANGDLTSPPMILDLGIPKSLKAPDVKLHALFVGVSDYAGEAGDLEAPSNDAIALSGTIRGVAERLLPGRVDTTVLTTNSSDATQRPTRANVLKWFQDLRKTATSSDVVLVFFAGHGVSEIGTQRGYFFLTSEADPGDISPTMVGTSTISGDDLKRELGAIAANKQVVILDTCHSGAASKELMTADRSISGDYQRAWEAIRETTGTWMLAGAASDQKSYESSNVEHGMLTYALLEAIDKASPDGLRKTDGTDMFVDVERWLTYAANRVESLKNEVGVRGVQRPEFKRSPSSSSFDIGVLDSTKRGSVGLKPPKPILLVGTFAQDEEDPLKLELAVESSLRTGQVFKAWFDVPKHPNVYRVAGTYSSDGDIIKLRVVLQRLDANEERKNIATMELVGSKKDLPALAAQVKAKVEAKLREIEEAADK